MWISVIFFVGTGAVQHNTYDVGQPLLMGSIYKVFQVETTPNRSHRLCPVDPAGIAPPLRVVDVNVADRGIGKQLADQRFHGGAIHDLGVEHHPVFCIAAKRQLADSHAFRYLIDSIKRLPCPLSYENRV